MSVEQFGLFIVSIFQPFWNFLFTPVFYGISIGSLVLVFMMLSLIITFLFRR